MHPSSAGGDAEQPAHGAEAEDEEEQEEEESHASQPAPSVSGNGASTGNGARALTFVHMYALRLVAISRICVCACLAGWELVPGCIDLRPDGDERVIRSADVRTACVGARVHGRMHTMRNVCTVKVCGCVIAWFRSCERARVYVDASACTCTLACLHARWHARWHAQ